MTILRTVTAATAALTLALSSVVLPTALAQDSAPAADTAPAPADATQDTQTPSADGNPGSDIPADQPAELPADESAGEDPADAAPDTPADAPADAAPDAPVDATPNAPTDVRTGTAELAKISPLDLGAQLQPYLKEGTTRTYENVPDKLKWMQRVYQYSDNRSKVIPLTAHSPSMDFDVPLAVITPDGTFDSSRPTLYLLNGAGGAEQGMDWITMTAYGNYPDDENIVEFYSQKNVNVVIPQAGAFTYYTDWLTAPKTNYIPQDNVKWETFLTKELPGPLEDYINGNGKRAIAGMSMSATSSLLLAEHNPGFYDAVGSYSGCAATSTLLPNMYVGLTLERGGATPQQMWGPLGGKYNVYNDALVNANNLKDTELYISTNSGLAGENDFTTSSKIKAFGSDSAFATSSELIVVGGAIEAAMNSCTHDLRAKLERNNIPATYKFRNTGTHSWPGWRADLADSWPVYEKAFAED